MLNAEVLCPTEEHQGQGKAGFWDWGWDWGDVSSCFCLQGFSMWAFAWREPPPQTTALSQFGGLGQWRAWPQRHPYLAEPGRW